MKKNNSYIIILLSILSILSYACSLNTPNPSLTNTNNTPSSVPTSTSSASSFTFIPIPTVSNSPVNDIEIGENLIDNPGAEIQDTKKDAPANWIQNSFGNIESVFSWGTQDPFSGKKYLSISVNKHTDGDAKWYFAPKTLKVNSWYKYSEVYRSNVKTRFTYLIDNPNKPQTNFPEVWKVDPSDSWNEASFRFYIMSKETSHRSIMHIIDRQGWLDTDEHKLIEIKPHPLPFPVVSITFDDIKKTAVSIGLPELEKRGIKGTFFITKNLVLNPDNSNADMVAVSKLVKQKHEIGSHSATHSYLAEMTPDKINDEMSESIKFLKEDLTIYPKGIAYPFGDFSDIVGQKAKTYFYYARTTLDGFNDALFDQYKLKIKSVNNKTTSEQLIEWVDEAKQTSTWLILLFHDLGDPNPVNEYMVPTAYFTTLLDYIQKQNIAVMTVSEAIEKLRGISIN